VQAAGYPPSPPGGSSGAAGFAAGRQPTYNSAASPLMHCNTKTGPMDAATETSAGPHARQQTEPAARAEALLAAMRDNMVDSQVRPNKVIDTRIIGAMRRLPRERFLPPAQRHLAYTDAEIRLPRGRGMLAPMAIARLVQLLAPASGERALVVGAGAGYGACLLAACGTTVTALEDDPELLALARTVLPALAPDIRLVSFPLAEGWAAGAPYDLILLEGAVQAIPPALARQLVPRTGRLATVLADGQGPAVAAGAAAEGRAVLAELTPAGLHPQPAFDCAARLIPALLPPPTFTF
jgi:protein-L-isoaspartate(D-aspartate) O-methyltransferase